MNWIRQEAVTRFLQDDISSLDTVRPVLPLQLVDDVGDDVSLGQEVSAVYRGEELGGPVAGLLVHLLLWSLGHLRGLVSHSHPGLCK